MMCFEQSVIRYVTCCFPFRVQVCFYFVWRSIFNYFVFWLFVSERHGWLEFKENCGG